MKKNMTGIMRNAMKSIIMIAMRQNVIMVRLRLSLLIMENDEENFCKK